MSCLTRAELTRKPEKARKKIDLPEFGDGAYVWIRCPSALEIMQLRDAMKSEKEPKLLARTVAMFCRDDEDNRVFSVDDIEKLEEQDAGVMKRLFEQCWAFVEKGPSVEGELKK